MRLLRRLPEVPSRDQRLAAILLGPPDPGREIPHHAVGPGDARLRPAVAGEDQGPVPHLAPPRADIRRAVATCRGEGPPRIAHRGTASADATRTPNIANRFRDHGDAYFTFLDTPGIEPTNNGSERQIRFLTIDRKITQGTRSEAGRRWCERIWTVLATCAQQDRSAFAFLHRTIVAHFTGQRFHSLLPQPP